MMRGLLLTTLAAVGLVVAPAIALDRPPYDLEGHVKLARHGKKTTQFLPMKLETNLTPETQVDDAVEARIIVPVDFESITLPLDSRLKGIVTAHKPGERFGRRARLNIQWRQWCPQGQACQTIPEDQPHSLLPTADTGTSRGAFKRFLPLQLLSYGISIPLGLTAMPLWSTMFIESGVGAAIGATYETVRPEVENETKAKKLVKGALNSTSLPTITRFVKKAPDINIPANTALWMPVDQQMLSWISQQDAKK